MTFTKKAIPIQNLPFFLREGITLKYIIYIGVNNSSKFGKYGIKYRTTFKHELELCNLI